jgi:hypothetical protein
MNALVVAMKSFAMLFEDRKLILQRGGIAVNVTGIAILRHQLERHLLSIASDQQGNMGLLDSFGLVDRAPYHVRFSLKRGFFLCPHRKEDLKGFVQPEVGQMYYHLSIEKALDQLSIYLQELDRQGSFHIPNPRLSAQFFLALLQGQIVERARLGIEPSPTSAEIEQHIDACVTFFLAAHPVDRPA